MCDVHRDCDWSESTTIYGPPVKLSTNKFARPKTRQAETSLAVGEADSPTMRIAGMFWLLCCDSQCHSLLTVSGMPRVTCQYITHIMVPRSSRAAVVIRNMHAAINNMEISSIK